MRVFAHRRAAVRRPRSSRAPAAVARPPESRGDRRPVYDILCTRRAGVPEIQRKVSTSGGDWDTVRYDPDNQKTNRGLDVVLRFIPDVKAVPHVTTIGLVQAVRSRRQGHVTFVRDRHGEAARSRAIDPKEARKISVGGTDEGFHIDQQADAKSPFYAAGAYRKGDTAATVHATGTTASRHATIKEVKGRKKATSAYLKDTPGLSLADRDSGQHFEVAALAIDGVPAGTYYGSVTYGWETDKRGSFTKLPLKLKSPTVPSSTFLKAASLWNKDGLSRFRLAVPRVYVATAGVNFHPAAKRRKRGRKRVPFLDKGTRLVLQWPDYPLRRSSVFWNVRVVDGPFAGEVGRVQPTHLEQEEKQRPSTP